MPDYDQTMPQPVADLIDELLDAVDATYGFELDLTPETMPVVDQYLRELADQPRDTRDDKLRPVASYFGEVLRRVFSGTWVRSGDNVGRWRIGFERCFLHLSPFGMAGEVMMGEESARFDGSFSVHDDMHDDLAEMLAHAVPMSEEQYYSLSGRIEILQLVADWLIGRVLAQGEEPRLLGEEDYAEACAAAETDVVSPAS